MLLNQHNCLSRQIVALISNLQLTGEVLLTPSFLLCPMSNVAGIVRSADMLPVIFFSVIVNIVVSENGNCQIVVSENVSLTG